MMRGGEFILPVDKLPDIFSIDDLSVEQKLIRQTVQEFVADTIGKKEVYAALESKDFVLTRKVMIELAETGLLGVEIPEEFGGGGLDKISSMIVTEEIAPLGSMAVSVLAHKGIGTWPIVLFGTREQKEKYLPKLASGEWIGAYSLTEGGSGSDANAARSTAVKINGGYMLNGEKIFVTNGGFADIFTVFVKLDGKLTAFIVEKNFSGVVIGREEHKMGICGSSTTTLILNDVFVPDSNLLGESGKGFKIAMNVLNLGRFILGVACLGSGRLCLEEATKYAKERKQFGRPIIEFGLIRQKLAEMSAKIFAMESVMYRLAGLLEEACSQINAEDSNAVLKAIGEYAIECSLVKVFCSEALDYITDENVQIHGGSGFCEELPVARRYRDARINRIFEGTNEINRLFAISVFLKRAGELSLPAAISQVLGEAIAPSQSVGPSDLIGKLLLQLNSAKKATLLASGTVAQTFHKPEELESHQFILSQLCDSIISIYVLESVLAVLAKNSGVNDCRSYLTRLLFSQMLPEIGERLKNVVAGCVMGDDLRMRLSAIRRFLKSEPENIEFLHKQIMGA
ncbi:MAG: acyl-CoA dehydrogenase family protein [Candidatus Yanofskybacteria bacterium]|nr:acyl-CoA dehydrogenase family protein [Candidatus Yanofskybacteria bacterium]